MKPPTLTACVSLVPSGSASREGRGAGASLTAQLRDSQEVLRKGPTAERQVTMAFNHEAGPVAVTSLTLPGAPVAAWKAQSESTAWSKAFSERSFVLDAEHRYQRNARHSKAIAVKKARTPIKTGGCMGRRIKGLPAGIWLVKLSM